MSKKNPLIHYSDLHGYIVQDTEDGFDGCDVDPSELFKIEYNEVLNQSFCLQYSIHKNKAKKRKKEDLEEDNQKGPLKEIKEIGNDMEEKGSRVEETEVEEPTHSSLDPVDLGCYVEETEFDEHDEYVGIDVSGIDYGIEKEEKMNREEEELRRRRRIWKRRIWK
ncbi:uncharacterized protein LOC141645945 [Silene latifolia]|uniref:uncharacterized protein LOC141645945 n=1 Tax=Silene latifolia TaxID=37657 RepID=UPI003D7799DE